MNAHCHHQDGYIDILSENENKVNRFTNKENKGFFGFSSNWLIKYPLFLV